MTWEKSDRESANSGSLATAAISGLRDRQSPQHPGWRATRLRSARYLVQLCEEAAPVNKSLWLDDQHLADDGFDNVHWPFMKRQGHQPTRTMGGVINSYDKRNPK
jgi:ABC-type hemin transport system ATPase subunit